MEKVPTGIYGLDSLIEGGFNKNSATIVVGATGTGKSTLALQFLRKGLSLGEEGVYITLEERKEQIIAEAAEMGWMDLKDYLEDGQLVFIEARGFEFSQFIKEELPEFVSEWDGADARIAIDPLTPIVWTSQEKYRQRELIATLFNETKRIGTVVSTLEEHGTFGDLSGPETVIPMYLSDLIVHLKYIVRPMPETLPEEGITTTSSVLRLLKSRSSYHSPISHPYHIIRDVGLVVSEIKAAKKTAGIPDSFMEKLDAVCEKAPRHRQDWVARIVASVAGLAPENPEKILKTILNDEGIELE